VRGRSFSFSFKTLQRCLSGRSAEASLMLTEKQHLFKVSVVMGEGMGKYSQPLTF
jgi:hypothetical protein